MEVAIQFINVDGKDAIKFETPDDSLYYQFQLKTVISLNEDEECYELTMYGVTVKFVFDFDEGTLTKIIVSNTNSTLDGTYEYKEASPETGVNNLTLLSVLALSGFSMIIALKKKNTAR